MRDIKKYLILYIHTTIICNQIERTIDKKCIIVIYHNTPIHFSILLTLGHTVCFMDVNLNSTKYVNASYIINIVYSHIVTKVHLLPTTQNHLSRKG